MEYTILLDRTVRHTDTNFRFYLYNLHNTTGHTVTYIFALRAFNVNWFLYKCPYSEQGDSMKLNTEQM